MRAIVRWSHPSAYASQTLDRSITRETGQRPIEIDRRYDVP
jgi:hypothetical protein